MKKATAEKQAYIKKKLEESQAKREMAIKQQRDTIEEKIRLGEIKTNEIKAQKQKEIEEQKQKALEKQAQLDAIKEQAIRDEEIKSMKLKEQMELTE